MNDEQSKRLADAAESLVQAIDALADARDLLNDRRFDSEQERERVAAGQNLQAKVDNAAKRAEEAVRKGVVAAAAADRGTDVYGRYLRALASVREGRTKGRAITEQDGSANKRAKAEEALADIQAAVDAAASLILPE